MNSSISFSLEKPPASHLLPSPTSTTQIKEASEKTYQQIPLRPIPGPNQLSTTQFFSERRFRRLCKEHQPQIQRTEKCFFQNTTQPIKIKYVNRELSNQEDGTPAKKRSKDPIPALKNLVATPNHFEETAKETQQNKSLQTDQNEWLDLPVNRCGDMDWLKESLDFFDE